VRLRQEIEQLQNPHKGSPLNILLCGAPGVGKSTTINSLSRALNGEPNNIVDTKSTTSGSCTINYCGPKIWLDKAKILGFRLFDTKGAAGLLTTSSTDGIVLPQCLDGEFTTGRDMNCPETDGLFFAKRSQVDRLIHAVIFVTSYLDPGHRNAEEKNSLIKLIADECSARNIPLFIAFTHLDMQKKMKEKNDEEFDSKQKVEDTYSKVKHRHLIPLANYHDTWDVVDVSKAYWNSNFMDKLLLSALKIVLQAADQHKDEFLASRWAQLKEKQKCILL